VRAFYDTNPELGVLEYLRATLERVSVKGETHLLERDGEPIPQAARIGFVRGAPNLRWFGRDLTPDSVAMLRRELPDGSFVSQLVASAIPRAPYYGNGR
jgi:hypothetical protein